MILKELDPGAGGDRFSKAGRKAEKQLAHYLKRAFADSPAIRVLNDLKLERNGEVAQIDHLALHKYGVVIIESKSVTTCVSINAHDEWTREYAGSWHGMRSPVLQASRQGDLLRALLIDHHDELLDKMLGFIQTSFTAMALDILVAIADSGQIKRHCPEQAPEVMKADQVPYRIQELVGRYEAMNSLFNLRLRDIAAAPRSFSDSELSRMGVFLRTRHQPLTPCERAREPAEDITKTAQEPKPGSTSENGRPPVCRYCSSSSLVVKYGKYGYYFKCQDCNGNTPIKARCYRCNSKARLRKQRQHFYSEFPTCGGSDLFFSNTGLE